MFRLRNLLAQSGASRNRRASAAPNRSNWRALFALLAVTLVGAFAVPASADDDSYKVVDGLAAYLGVMPSGLVKGHPTGHPEAAMHGGASGARHEYHVLIALFDSVTGARVEDAKVTANISGLGHVGGTNVELEPMTIAGTVTYAGESHLESD